MTTGTSTQGDLFERSGERVAVSRMEDLLPRAWISVDLPRPFVMFEDGARWNDEPIAAEDLFKVRVNAPAAHSMAWSANAKFIILAIGSNVTVCRVGSLEGWCCSKRSTQFVKAVVEGGLEGYSHAR